MIRCSARSRGASLKSVRPNDLVGRFGGEEIIVLLPGASRDQASMVAERLRRAVCTTTVAISDREVTQTVSIGLAAYPENGRSVEELMAKADNALYRAKETGRNRVGEA